MQQLCFARPSQQLGHGCVLENGEGEHLHL